MIFCRNTGWTPDISWTVSDQGTVIAQGGRGGYWHYFAARPWTAMRYQFPMLSDQELQEYCGPPVFLHDLTETERLMNVVRRAQGNGQVDEAAAGAPTSERKGRNIHDAIIVDDDSDDEA